MFDAMTLITDLEKVGNDLKTIVTDLEAVGVDVQSLFAQFATPHGVAKMEAAAPLAAPEKIDPARWAKLLQLLKTYGPVIYAMLAAMLGWPPIPVITGA